MSWGVVRKSVLRTVGFGCGEGGFVCEIGCEKSGIGRKVREVTVMVVWGLRGVREWRCPVQMQRYSCCAEGFLEADASYAEVLNEEVFQERSSGHESSTGNVLSDGDRCAGTVLEGLRIDRLSFKRQGFI